MTERNEDPGDAMEQLRAFARRHKTALIAGGVLLLALSFANKQEDAAGSAAPVVSGGEGFDKREWDAEQRRDDGMQRDRVDGIREVERCMGEDGRVYEVPIGTCS